MKAIILAAGLGSRLGDVKGDLPKCFVEVKGKPIIQHQIDTLRKHGVEEIIIVTGYRREAFAHFADEGITLEYNPFFRAVSVLGSFWFARKHLTSPFIFAHADTYFEDAVLEKLLAAPQNALANDYKKCGDEEMKFKAEGKLVKKVSKQLDDHDGEFIGILKIEDYDKVREKMDTIIEKEHGNFFEEVIQQLINEGIPMHSVDITGHIWEEVDFAEDYENLKKKLEET